MRRVRVANRRHSLCVRALGPERVLALLLPERDSSPEALRLGTQLADHLGVERVVEDITAMRQRAQEFEDNPDLVRGIITEGCEKARAVASQTLDDVKQAMGLGYR